ncbi:hypothetical protein [Sedimenticola sp.]|uniref:hypothetical protein n=1 Tax=Sedimenticola sp. TaxID=1940285 RepID=UPI003D0C90B3
MRFLRNLLLFVVLVYGLAYGYLWYETNNTLQRITEGAAPFAKIDYASFFVSPLANEITVDNISIVPQMAADEFRIEQARLYADQPGFFLLSGKAMQEGALPEKVGANLSNVQVNMDGKFITLLGDMAQQSQETSGQAPMPFANLDALGCGDIEQFQLVDYRMMGMRRLNLDLNLHLSYDKIGEIFGLQVDANTRGVYDISVATDFKVPNGEMGGVTNTDKIPPMRFSINDTGFYKMRNSYCATANDSSIDEYIDHHMQLLSSAFGVTLPEKTAQAYRSHMLKGGRINISIKPQNDIAPAELAYYKPLEVAELLGLNISIGNTRVELEQLFNANAPAVVAKSEQPAKIKPRTSSTRPEPSVVKKLTTTPAPSRPTFHVEKVDNAHKHIDKLVEVTLPGNKVRRGTLEQVRNGRLYLVMELQGGSITYPVRKTEISKFRVRY